MRMCNCHPTIKINYKMNGRTSCIPFSVWYYEGLFLAFQTKRTIWEIEKRMKNRNFQDWGLDVTFFQTHVQYEKSGVR